MKAATAAMNVASAGEPATAARAAAALLALPAISVTAGVPAVEPDTALERRGARDRVARRSPGPSVALMTRAYVSVIASHAAPYRFMPKHQCFMPIVGLTAIPDAPVKQR
jgi:hypothetical protein